MNAVDVSSTITKGTVRTSAGRGLQLFGHQVAGQSLILQYDSSTICKCLTQREYHFYQAVPKCLQPFVPEFRGVIQLYLPDTNSYNECPQDFSLSGSYSYCEAPKGLQLAWEQSHCPSMNHLSDEVVLEPRRMRALRKTTRNNRSGTNDDVYYFMLLEDLISRYKRPCILDLKMGVRQHGDDAPPEKVAYQVNKCKTTTSASLGLRLCGMKKYDILSAGYETKDKMCGRQLNDDDLKYQIVNFLFNGQDFHNELVNLLLCKLKNLKNVIEHLDGYRFYSSSLLIIYEGDIGILSEQCESSRSTNDQTESDYLLDCQNEKSENVGSGDEESKGEHYEDIVTKNVEDSGNSRCLYSDETHGDSPCFDEHIQSHRAVENYPRFQIKSPFSTREETSNEHSDKLSMKNLSNMVDVRIVDFAHATFDGFLCDPVKHCGPDRGFLLGVNTLIEVFTELKDRDVL